MPLPAIRMGTARQCQAKARSTGNRCLRLASFGTVVCLKHGAFMLRAKPSNIKHGRLTRTAIAETRVNNILLQNFQDVLVLLGAMPDHKFRGRPIGGYTKINTLEEAEAFVEKLMGQSKFSKNDYTKK